MTTSVLLAGKEYFRDKRLQIAVSESDTSSLQQVLKPKQQFDFGITSVVSNHQ